MVFFEKSDAKLEKGTWGRGRGGEAVRAVALMSVLAEWYVAVMVGLLQEEPELVEWKALAVGAEGMVNCEHMQALLTIFFAETLGVAGGSARDVGSGVQVTHTAFVASLDVRTAFDVATPSVVSRIPNCMVTHGPVVAALLEKMKDVRGSASGITRRSFVWHDAQGRAAWRGKGGRICIVKRR